MDSVDNQKMNSRRVIEGVLFLVVPEWVVFPLVEIDLGLVGFGYVVPAPEFGISLVEVCFPSPHLLPLLVADSLESEACMEEGHLVNSLLSLVSLSLPVKASLSNFLDERPRTADVLKASGGLAEPQTYFLQVLWKTAPYLDDRWVFENGDQELKQSGKLFCLGSILCLDLRVSEHLAVVDVESCPSVGGEYGAMRNLSTSVHAFQIECENSVNL